MKRPNRRKYFVIDSLQYRLLAVTVAHFFVITLLIAVTLFLPLILKMESEKLTPIEKQEAAAEFLSLHARFWPAMLGILILLSVHSLVVSRRVAGPLAGFRRTLKAIGEGDLTVRARIRRFDYLSKEAASINEMLDNIRERLRRLQEEYGQAYGMWLEFKGGLAPGLAGELGRHSADLGARLDGVKGILEEFRVRPGEASHGEGLPLATGEP
jgi:methyl-accepting chemotaxis protein